MEINPSDIRAMVHIATKRTGTPVHDEDLEQEIALRAVEAFRRIDRVTHPRALLMKIVHDTVQEHWRHRRSSEDLDSVAERFISQAPTFEYDLDLRRRKSRSYSKVGAWEMHRSATESRSSDERR